MNAVSLVSGEISTWVEAEGRIFSFLPVRLCCGHRVNSQLLETGIWKTKCASLVKLKGTGCLLLPNLPELEFSSPLCFCLCAHHLQFYRSPLCFAWESVKGEEYIPSRTGPEGKFVNNKKGYICFSRKGSLIFFPPMSQFIGLFYVAKPLD